MEFDGVTKILPKNSIEPIQMNSLAQKVQKEQKNEEKAHEIKKETIKKEISSVNQFLKSSQTSVKFQLHEKLHEYYVQIIDDNTKEVIKEIPPKKFLDMYANIMKQIGLIIDHRI